MDNMPKCSCNKNKCTCGFSKKLQEHYHMLKQPVFNGIRRTMYFSVLSNFGYEVYASVNQAYVILLQVENQRESSTSTSFKPDNMAMLARNSFNATRFKKPTQKTIYPRTLHFDYCSGSGHTRERCFCLHGIPPWHRLHGRPKPKPMNNLPTVNLK